MMYSTMGAPLSQEETTAIEDAWGGLREAAQRISLPIPDNSRRGEDCVAMLNRATDLVMAVSALRTAISNAWHYANKRAFPDPDRSVIGGGLRRRPSNTVSTKAALAQLNLTEAEFDELLKGVTTDATIPRT
jgi:hypothetical protein